MTIKMNLVPPFRERVLHMASDEETDPMDDFELPLVIPKRDGPDCPFCGDPMMSVDGDYICIDCNGTWYGPNIG